MPKGNETTTGTGSAWGRPPTGELARRQQEVRQQAERERQEQAEAASWSTATSSHSDQQRAALSRKQEIVAEVQTMGGVDGVWDTTSAGAGENRVPFRIHIYGDAYGLLRNTTRTLEAHLHTPNITAVSGDAATSASGRRIVVFYARNGTILASGLYNHDRDDSYGFLFAIP